MNEGPLFHLCANGLPNRLLSCWRLCCYRMSKLRVRTSKTLILFSATFRRLLSRAAARNTWIEERVEAMAMARYAHAVDTAADTAAAAKASADAAATVAPERSGARARPTLEDRAARHAPVRIPDEGRGAGAGRRCQISGLGTTSFLQLARWHFVCGMCHVRWEGRPGRPS